MLIRTLVALTALPGFAAAQTYEVIDLGTAGGDNGWAFGVNSDDFAVGSVQTGIASDRIAFATDFNGLQTLGLLPGTTSSFAVDLNDHGTAVGYSGSLLESTRAFTWTADVGIVAIGTLGGAESYARGINGMGDVVGRAQLPNGREHAFLFSAGIISDLGALPGDEFSQAYAISDAGVIVGESARVRGDAPRAVAWFGGALTDLGVLGGFESSARDVNELGQIVGVSDDADGRDHAFLWMGEMVPLGTLGGSASRAMAINERQQVVGRSTNEAGQQRGFLWHRDEMVDLSARLLPGSEWSIDSANDINDRSVIVGFATRWSDGATRAVLLRRVVGPCDGDYDADGRFTSLDVLAFLLDLNTNHPKADFTADGLNNSADFVVFLNAYAGGC